MSGKILQAGDFVVQTNFKNTLMKACFEAALTHHFVSKSEFWCHFNDVFLTEVLLRPLAGPWAPHIAPRSLFGCIFGAPGSHFGQLLVSLGRPGCPSGQIFLSLALPKQRQVQTMMLQLFFFACSRQRELPQPAKCLENIMHTMHFGRDHFRKFCRKSVPRSSPK